MPYEQPRQKPVEHPEHAPTQDNLSAAASHVAAGRGMLPPKPGLEREASSIATAALIGVGVAIIEPELIPGLLIGAGAVLAPKILPGIGSMLRPLVKGVIKAGYSTATAVRETVAEMGEQVEDIVAEARAEQGMKSDAGAQQAAAQQRPKRRRRRQAPSPAPAANL